MLDPVSYGIWLAVVLTEVISLICMIREERSSSTSPSYCICAAASPVSWVLTPSFEIRDITQTLTTTFFSTQSRSSQSASISSS